MSIFNNPRYKLSWLIATRNNEKDKQTNKAIENDYPKAIVEGECSEAEII